MNVYIVVQHYDRGSDEFHIEGVFSTLEKATEFVETNFKGWNMTEDDLEMLDGDDEVLGIWLYSDPDASNVSDRVIITVHEVQ